MTVALRRPMTHEEFFAWAESQEGGFEFDGFQPVAMTGGTNLHGKVVRNLLFQLSLRLRGRACDPMGPEGGGVETTGGRIRYPDALVTCAPQNDRARLVRDPVVVFEVVSESSARNDRIHKVREYHAVPSIKRYVLIEQDVAAVTALFREADEPWSVGTFGEGETMPLPEIGVELVIDDLYEGVNFPQQQPPEL